jgi:hypothetical protein
LPLPGTHWSDWQLSLLYAKATVTHREKYERERLPGAMFVSKKLDLDREKPASMPHKMRVGKGNPHLALRSFLNYTLAMKAQPVNPKLKPFDKIFDASLSVGYVYQPVGVSIHRNFGIVRGAKQAEMV